MLDCYHEHWNDATHEHIVQPGMVYISNPTEIGSIYHRSELQALAAACRECGLPLFMDGARLGYGLAAEDNDLDLPTILSLIHISLAAKPERRGLLFGGKVEGVGQLGGLFQPLCELAGGLGLEHDFQNGLVELLLLLVDDDVAVSYTHLDVYKRQA